MTKPRSRLRLAAMTAATLALPIAMSECAMIGKMMGAKCGAKGNPNGG